jgi:hypothetical protein
LRSIATFFGIAVSPFLACASLEVTLGLSADGLGRRYKTFFCFVTDLPAKVS